MVDRQGDPLDQHAGQSWANHVRCGSAGGARSVGGDQRRRCHKRGQVGHERRGEQHLQHTQHKAGAVQQLDP